MTPLTCCLIAALVVAVALAVTIRSVRRRLPRPDAPSDRYDDLVAGIGRAREESAARTRALNTELELLRRRGTGHGR